MERPGFLSVHALFSERPRNSEFDTLRVLGLGFRAWVWDLEF